MVEPRLQHDCGSHLVDDLATLTRIEAGLAHPPFGGHRREPLVVHLHRHPDHASELTGLGLGRSSGRPAGSVERQWQPHHHHLGLLVADQFGDCGVVVAPRRRTMHRGQRRSNGGREVAHRNADALGTEIDAECTNAGNPTLENTAVGGAHAPVATAIA